MPRDSSISTLVCPDIAGKIDLCTLGITKKSITPNPIVSTAAFTAEFTAATSPPIKVMYLPEQIVRDRMSSTSDVLSIISAACIPEAMLPISISPIEFISVIIIPIYLFLYNLRLPEKPVLILRHECVRQAYFQGLTQLHH